MNLNGKSNFAYRVIEVNEPLAQDFDLEAWLADLLVNEWLSSQEGGDAEQTG